MPPATCRKSSCSKHQRGQRECFDPFVSAAILATLTRLAIPAILIIHFNLVVLNVAHLILVVRYCHGSLLVHKNTWAEPRKSFLSREQL